MLWQRPGFTLAIALTLTLGIGANTTIGRIIKLDATDYRVVGVMPPGHGGQPIRPEPRQITKARVLPRGLASATTAWSRNATNVLACYLPARRAVRAESLVSSMFR